MSIIFNNESRPDLAEAIRTDYTAEYVFPKVLPVINVYEEAGQIAVATQVAVSATTNRVYNADLTLNHLGNTAISYATSAYEARVAVTDADLKLKGDDLNLILPEMANAAGEAAIGAVEEAAYTTLATVASATPVTLGNTPLAGIASAAYQVAPYGEPTLVVSQSFLADLLKISAFTDPILKLFGEGVITGLVGGADAVLKSVGGWMGLPGGIIIGKDDFWGTGDLGFVVATRPEMRDPSRAYWTAKAKPSLGATLTFLPRDREGTPWYCDTVYLPGPRINAVDVGIKAAPKLFNAGAVKGIAVGN